MTQRSSRVDDGAPGEALATALARLVSDGTLTSAQAKAVTRAVRAQLRRAAVVGGPAGTAVPTSIGTTDDGSPPALPGPGWALLVAEIGGYLGAAFVLGAATILVSDNWHRLGTAVRLAVLAVPALLLAAAAVATARTVPGGWRPRPDREPAPGVAPRRRLVSLLLALATALGGATASVAAQSRGVNGDWAAFAFAWASVAMAAVAYRWCRSELLHTVLGIALATGTIASLRVTGWYGTRATGSAFVVVGLVWAVATLRGLLSERGLGFGWGGVLIFVGAELLTTADPEVVGYAVLTLLAAGGLAGYSWGRSLTLLVIGAATLAVLVPQAVIDATNGTLSSSGALLVAGLSIVAASALGFRLHRTPPPPPG